MTNPIATCLKPLVRRRRAATASVGVLLAGAVWVQRSPPDVSRWPTAHVREAPFTDTIVEVGEISASRMMLYAAPLSNGASKIVEIVPEGTAVSPGDLLIRFDTTSLELALQKEEAALQQSNSELLRAREELWLERLRAAAELDSAAEDVQAAKRTLASDRDGKGRLALEEATAALAEARREETRTRTAFGDIKPMLAEGFVTRAEVERAEQAWQRAQDNLRLAGLRLESLTQFETPAAVERSKAGLRAAEQSVGRTRQTAASRLAQHEAAAAITAGAVDAIRARLASIRDQLSRSVVRANGRGLVVYRDLFFGTDRRKPQVGDEVFPNQPLIVLPDDSSLVVETRVREIDLHRIAASQRVSVVLDAYPSLRLPGAVSLVGALAQEDPNRAGTKFFPVTVHLFAGDSRLRTGMTARIEIEAASMPRALVVPAEAVFEDEGTRYCVVLDDGRPVRRDVRVSASNDSAVAVAAGVSAGDVVLLVDPTRSVP